MQRTLNALLTPLNRAEWTNGIRGSAIVTPVKFVTFSQTSGFEDETLRLLDAVIGEQVGDVRCVHSKSVECVAFSQNGTCSESGLRDSTTGAEVCVHVKSR